tara:strand:+ start:535 stop:720 length:186 start_codon:yes stop_codon:yes gene_type:complete
LDLSKTPLEYFAVLYPTDTKEDLRKYLGRFGVSGKMQVQVMGEVSERSERALMKTSIHNRD